MRRADSSAVALTAACAVTTDCCAGLICEGNACSAPPTCGDGKCNPPEKRKTAAAPTADVSWERIAALQTHACIAASISMTWTFTDSCVDGLGIQYRFFDSVNGLVWPSALSNTFQSTADGQTVDSSIAVHRQGADDLLRRGAEPHKRHCLLGRRSEWHAGVRRVLRCVRNLEPAESILRVSESRRRLVHATPGASPRHSAGRVPCAYYDALRSPLPGFLRCTRPPSRIPALSRPRHPPTANLNPFVESSIPTAPTTHRRAGVANRERQTGRMTRIRHARTEPQSVDLASWVGLPDTPDDAEVWSENNESFEAVHGGDCRRTRQRVRL